MAKKDGEDKEIRNYSNYIIGILSIVLAVVSPWGIGGIILGIVGLSRIGKDKSSISKKARTFNLIGLIIGIVFFIVTAILILNQMDLNGLQY